VVEVLHASAAWLKERGVPSARLDTELILAHALALDRVKVYLQFDRPLEERELEAVRALVRRRGAREPLAWVLGHKGFHALDLVVKPGVLVPRPDTETLVEVAIEAVGDADPVYVADVGCGTGCVGLALAVARPGVRLYAVDLDRTALENTRLNVEALGLRARVAVRRGDLLEGVPANRPIDWVVSNPPYIARADLEALEPEVRLHEPRLALDGGDDGLDLYRRLIPAAAGRARCGVLVEVGAGQAAAVAELMIARGLAVTVTPDLAGTPRVVSGRRSLPAAPG
jgi:release factor glutamine methyltransferase